MVSKRATLSYPDDIQEDDNFGYTDEELNAKLEHSYQQVLRREGTPLKEIIAERKNKRANA